MSDKSKIEWTDATWNPLRGCSKVSPGCANCYAIGVAARFNGPGQAYEGLAKRDPLNWTGVVRTADDKLTEPLRWRRPRRVFVNSMSDLFHESVPDHWIDRIFAVMALCPLHTFQILTKRALRMREYFERLARRVQAWDAGEAETEEFLITRLHDDEMVESKAAQAACATWLETFNARHLGWPLPNVWLGVSVEDQQRADERIPDLLATPAAVRFVSAEPLLGPVNLQNVQRSDGWTIDSLRGIYGRWHEEGVDHPAALEEHGDGPSISWLIVGGESGPPARPMHPQWARDLRYQCVTADVPFFFKQHGEWVEGDAVPGGDLGGDFRRGNATILAADGSANDGHFRRARGDAIMRRVGKKAAGRLLDGREWSQWPAGEPAAKGGG